MNQTALHTTRPTPFGDPRSRSMLPPRVQSAFTQALLSSQLVTESSLQAAVDHAEARHLSLPDALVDLGLVPELTAYHLLADAAGVFFIDPNAIEPSPLALRLVPARVARRHELLPLAVDDRKLTYITARPFDAEAEKDVAFTSGRRAVPALSCASDLRAALDRIYPAASDLDRLLAKARTAAVVEEIDPVHVDSPPDSAIVELCNTLVARAVEAGGSDLHLDPSDDGILARLRVGGVLEQLMLLPNEIAGPVRNRFKVMARVDIATRHRPQDGAFGIDVHGRRIDVRLSTVPTTVGEKLVMRIIDSRSGFKTLSALGYQEDVIVRLRHVLDRPDGLFLATGPTGSGKTTALYAALHHLCDGRVNVVSVEDPVERELTGVNQIPVNPRAGATFASVLRSVLRQDPNVLMVGEIRDAEVAAIVGQAAYTGHLVLSSLHTIDAATAITRLLNLGLEPFRVAETLTGILAQRLVRRLCPQCSIREDSGRVLGPGCQACHQSGFVGRVPVAELLTPDDRVRNVIAHGATAIEIRQAMRESDIPSMRDHANSLIASGITSHAEVNRVLGAPDDASPSGTAGTTRPVVLIADDEPITRTLVHLLLDRDGYTVVEAHNGERAIELAAEHRPALIVMDLNMPQMNGYDAIAALRRTPGMQRIPIVVVTAEDGPVIEQQVLALGADDYIAKPFEPSVLTARIKAVFARQRLAA